MAWGREACRRHQERVAETLQQWEMKFRAAEGLGRCTWSSITQSVESNIRTQRIGRDKSEKRIQKLEEEDQSGKASKKRSHPVNILDAMAGKAAFGGACWDAQRHGSRKALSHGSEVREEKSTSWDGTCVLCCE